jgi:riboflavin kinase/FMN adenylyltransferase
MNFPLHSAEVREALAEGNIQKANILLGSEYFLTGKVIHGDHLGAKIGFPTANLSLIENEKLLLPYGIYIVSVPLHGNVFHGLTNIGIRPTMGGTNLSIEVHLFDFNENLYDQILKVFFIDRLRDERKFSTLEELTVQIHKDKDAALKLLLRGDK